MAQTAQEVLVQCPYEKSHAVRRAILPMHLARCARNHNYSLVKCSFNYTHHVSQEALEEHEKHCPDRHPFEASLVNIREENYLAIPIEHIELPPSTEDWDDGVTNKFNPKEVTKSEDQENFIIRTRHCLAPAERKAFRRTQCTEAAIFEEKRNPLTIILPSKKMLPMDTPLRRPLSAPKAANSDQPSSSTWKSVSSAEPQIQQQSVLDAVKKFSQQKQPLSPDATASLDVVPHIPVPTKEVAKDLKPVSELPSAGWLSTGRGKAIVALRSSLDSHILPGGSLALPVGFGRGQNVHFM